MGCNTSIHAAPPSPGAQDAQECVKPQPVTPDSRLLRGQAYYASGKVAEALKELNATILTWPTYARAYLERGNIRLDQKDYHLAVGDYTTALQLQGNLLQAYLMRCNARMALRQFPEALQDAREAERLDPENAQVRALKTQVRKAAGGGPTPAPGGSYSGSADEDDAFAGVETPKSTPSPSVRKLCMVCMDAERECRLRPCMHAALCVECAEGLMTRGYGCPICSSKIEQVERGSFMRTFTVEEAQGIVASARIVTATSPGKSPLGRRFTAGTANGPSLDNIVEEDEEAHANADTSVRAVVAASNGGTPPAETNTTTTTTTTSSATAQPGAGGQERAVSIASTDSGNGGGVPSPVQLDPHPLTTRAQAAAAAAAAAASRRGLDAGGAGEGDDGAVGSPTLRPPPLPGAVEEMPPTPTVAPHRSSGGSGGGGTSGRNGPQRTSGGGSGDLPSPGAMSPGTSAQLANSLADWIDEHDSGGISAAATGIPASSNAAGGASGTAALPLGSCTSGALTSSSSPDPTQPSLAPPEGFGGFGAGGTSRAPSATPRANASSERSPNSNPNSSLGTARAPTDSSVRQSLPGPVAEAVSPGGSAGPCSSLSPSPSPSPSQQDSHRPHQPPGGLGPWGFGEGASGAVAAVVGSVFFNEDPRLLGLRHQAGPEDAPLMALQPPRGQALPVLGPGGWTSSRSLASRLAPRLPPQAPRGTVVVGMAAAGAAATFNVSRAALIGRVQSAGGCGSALREGRGGDCGESNPRSDGGGGGGCSTGGTGGSSGGAAAASGTPPPVCGGGDEDRVRRRGQQGGRGAAFGGGWVRCGADPASGDPLGPPTWEPGEARAAGAGRPAVRGR